MGVDVKRDARACVTHLSRDRDDACALPDEVRAERMTEVVQCELSSAFAAIRTVVDDGDAALRSELENWEPETRNAIARVLAELT